MATRARNGEGSVRAVKKDGKVVGYQAVLRTGGKPVYGPLVQDSSLARSALSKKLRDATLSAEAGEPFSISARRLLDGRLKKEWAPATLELGETVLARLDFLGELPWDRVKADDVLQWRLSLKAQGSGAKRYQLIVEKWLKLLGNPVKAEKPRVREPEIRILNRQEQAKLLDACETHRMRMAVLMAIEWGLRPGELCGLRHDDRHEDQMLINRSVDKKGRANNVKTDRSRAYLPIIDDELKEWIGSGKGYLLSTVSRTPLLPSNFRRMLISVCETAKIGAVTPMELRHTAAVNMLLAGIDPATVASITRHSVEVLLKIYYRTSPEAKTNALLKARAWRQVDTA